jgi:hypothetical protein
MDMRYLGDFNPHAGNSLEVDDTSSITDIQSTYMGLQPVTMKNNFIGQAPGAASRRSAAPQEEVAVRTSSFSKKGGKSDRRVTFSENPDVRRIEGEEEEEDAEVFSRDQDYLQIADSIEPAFPAAVVAAEAAAEDPAGDDGLIPPSSSYLGPPAFVSEPDDHHKHHWETVLAYFPPPPYVEDDGADHGWGDGSEDVAHAAPPKPERASRTASAAVAPRAPVMPSYDEIENEGPVSLPQELAEEKKKIPVERGALCEMWCGALWMCSVRFPHLDVRPFLQHPSPPPSPLPGH